jgi:hypothetical protein
MKYLSRVKFIFSSRHLVFKEILFLEDLYENIKQVCLEIKKEKK